MPDGRPDPPAAPADPQQGRYETSFAEGHRFLLRDRPGTFRVSRAGIALGEHLARHLTRREISGRILDVGTGSGAIALLLRSLGATRITATDIAQTALSTARQNELDNFGDSLIDFQHQDLFPGPSTAGDGRYDLVVFNPPGWRAPPPSVQTELASRRHTLDLRAMFYGDDVLLRFLRQLPHQLADGGRAVIGLNSLIGIADVLGRSHATPDVATQVRVLEKHEFPLFLYTDEWSEVRSMLIQEFERGRQEYAADFVTRGGTIHWFYEITEVTVAPSAGAPALVALDPLSLRP
jgi:release factor glutamine methyltransferase